MALAAAVLAAPAGARVLLSQQEALALAFPGCAVERSTLYLTPAQQERAGKLAGEPLRSALVTAYRATCDGNKPGGTAYFDVHRVRTLQETLMVVIDQESRVRRVEVLAFDEPTDYLPKRPWYDQFRGRALDADLRLKRGVRPVTGATLTAQATTAAARRALAIHQAVAETAAAAKPAPSPTSPAPARPAPAPTRQPQKP